MAILIIFSGLPGVGKTTIARELARQTGAVYLRADTIEQALREGGLPDDQMGGLGYMAAYAIATENLRLGLDVIADTVNPWELTREAWRKAAREAGASYLEIELVCEEAREHRRRVEEREPDIEGFQLPSWDDVVNRDYHKWITPRLVIDTSQANTERSVEQVLEEFSRLHP